MNLAALWSFAVLDLKWEGEEYAVDCTEQSASATSQSPPQSVSFTAAVKMFVGLFFLSFFPS